MTLDAKRLWAKSHAKNEPFRESMRLPQHLRDVHEAAGRVLDATGDAQLRALGLDPDAARDRFRRCLLLAAAVHDLGKANDHFQGMVRHVRPRESPQGVRHEWVTLLMLQDLKPWLLPAVAGSEEDFAVVEWAVAGHHAAPERETPPRTCPPGGGAEVRLHTAHPDFADILAWLRAEFALAGDPPALPGQARPLTGAGNVFAELAAWQKPQRKRWAALQDAGSDTVKLVAAVKDSLVAADVAGSALPKVFAEESQRWEWISDSFAALPAVEHLRAVAARRLGAHMPRPFQKAVGASAAPITYVKAGCGTGKTLAAYLWAAEQHPGRRLYFCYPTTGTATEGFKDYLFEPEGELGDIGAKLFHSRSEVDHQILLNPSGESRNAAADAAARVESLDAWATPVVACTVDTVLGIVQNNKRGLFGWPALAQAAFVFDEIHAYDDRLFGALLRFLRDLPGLPALLMTASLPKPREQALADVLRDARGITLAPITGPAELEDRPRYRKLADPGRDLVKRVADEVRGGGKVLWVSNTVKRVTASAEAAAAAGLKPLIYHSRFKYVDRVKRHQAVVGAFTEAHQGGALACTSQVCEMSLDLQGCTLLVTELAPVPALIQRLGRLNRHAKKNDPTRPFIVTDPGEESLPYTPAEFVAAREWLAKLPGDGVSQRHLADAWEQSSANPPDLVPSAWLDGGPATTVCELREASPGITVIMADDVPRAKGKDFGKYTLPMPPPPRAFEWRAWPKHQGVPVVPDAAFITYHPERGAEWNQPKK